ncbi:hypothetical protein F3Y22_tig00113716pilonHSYRG00087 [Hibiscus syriacus]|uniref:non-specific serine/threonine protein kinase n=1 Tax=Hibiscus syriacus TaxID=106335 RepID=A0A6A2Y2L0_HIBSY|nr:hypothetical protein F3Y22_tig00113716pilonHSYRG00087 [Hibiscus syriacus]
MSFSSIIENLRLVSVVVVAVAGVVTVITKKQKEKGTNISTKFNNHMKASPCLLSPVVFFHINVKLNESTITLSKTSRNVTELQALLAIKARIPVDPYGVFTSWNDSLHFCNWQGVTCDRQHRRVTALRLSSLKLAGDLSPHIANLTFLRVIDLGNNSFDGLIPQEVIRLRRLEELILINNSFQGELPRNLSRCSNLKVINLMGNALGGEIHAELGSLSRLQSLLLPINNFTGTIPPSLGNISSLLHFSLSWNHLEGNIPTELGQLSNLKFLQLSFNKLSGSVPKQLYNISSIYFFALAGNQLQGQIPPYIGLTLPNLEGLYLGVNKFSGPIPTSIVNSSRLVQLDMGLNSLSGPIPKNLGSLQNLENINLGGNFLESSNDLSFLTSLTNCTNLSQLWLSQNNLTGVLPDSIGNLSAKLNQLHIGTNYISGSIPKEIENLVGLEVLTFHENMLTGSIPESIGKFSKLKYFYAFTNNIIGEISHSLGNITELIVLNLFDNLLEGGIPASLGNCFRLEVLVLSQNRLNGTIPKDAIGLCSFLTDLSIRSNSLTGTLPPEVGNCKNLNFLDVSNNKLHGEIPSSLENCVMLESLYLQGNSFDAELPFFTNLNLSFNSFEGNLPTKGVFNNISAFSVLGNNELCGGIKPLLLPACPAEIAKKGNNFPHRAIIATVIVLFVVLFLICLFAIKRRMGADRTFKAECEALRHLRHRNLVKVITSCTSIDFQGNDFKALVFKLMPNGSLETWLHPSSTEAHNSPSLNLIQRLNISIDVASALDYLHSQFDRPVVHCDLKPSNILLDADLTAHISDFGLTRFLSETTEQSISEQSSSVGIRGTMGYIPPEYGMSKKISTHGDLYSYGIILIELFTGKRPTDMFTGELSLREYVKTAMPNHIAEIIDTRLNFEDETALKQNGKTSRGIGIIVKCLDSVLSIGVSCSDDSPSERMNIKDVLRELQKARNMLLGDHKG